MLNQNEQEYIKATLRLFNSVPEVLEQMNSSEEVCIPFADIRNSETLKHGFMLTQSAVLHCPFCNSEEGIALLTDIIGYDLLQLNRSFYESISQSYGTSAEEAFIQQLIHYFSTYGLTSLKLYQDKFVYIPAREFGNPEGSISPVKVKVVDYISDKDLVKRITNLIIKTSVALSEQSIKDIITIIRYLKIDLNFSLIRNKEVRIRLLSESEEVTADPEDLIRILLFRASKDTLFIKDIVHIGYLKIYAKNGECRELFNKYLTRYGKIRLAGVFFRLKPFFLALRRDDQLRPVINSIRKLAKTYHVPKSLGILDLITSKSDLFTRDAIVNELEKVSVFRKISILNAMLYRASNPESFSYFIRNGKVYSKSVEKCNYRFDFSLATKIFDCIKEEIKPQVQGKTIYIPEELDYACPVSEKKFVGGIPFGTSYKFKNRSLILGVHWFNVLTESGAEVQTDLDLHVQSNRRHVGWNTYCSTINQLSKENKEIIYSGDMTTAPKESGGAVEAVYTGSEITDEAVVFSLNNYSYSYNCSDVPFNLIISDESESDVFNRTYLIDNAPLMFNIPLEIHGQSLNLGILIADNQGNKTFYFDSSQNSYRTVSVYSEHTDNYVKSLKSKFASQLKLIPLLESAGAIVSRNPAAVCDLSLDPADLTKDSILNLFVH